MENPGEIIPPPDNNDIKKIKLISFFLVDRESFDFYFLLPIHACVIINNRNKMMQKILSNVSKSPKIFERGKFYFPAARISPLFRNYTKEHGGIMYRLRAWRREKKY